MAYDKVIDSAKLNGAMTATADAIRGKTGGTAQIPWNESTGFASAVGGISTSENLDAVLDEQETKLNRLLEVLDSKASGGGAPVEEKDVNFYDYDGTLLHAYTLDEVQEMTELPPNPTHDGLVAQGWNWTLEELKELGRECSVGQMYITDDGKTRIYIHLVEGRTSPVLGCCPKGTVTVDWGDGTTPDTLTGTSVTTVKWTPAHNYAAPGDYVITLTVSGSMGFYGSSGTSRSGLLQYATGNDGQNVVYLNSIQKIEIGSGITSIETYAFSYLFSLKSITIPKGITNIGGCAFYHCYSLTSCVVPSGVTGVLWSGFEYCFALESIAIPKSATNIGGTVFRYCYSLKRITIPDGVTVINAYLFNNCRSITSVSMPNGITSIGAYAFDSCHSLSSIKIPSSLTSIAANAFAECRSLADITLPDNMTSIATSVFQVCRCLTSIIIPEGVKSLGGYTFYECLSLTDITLPSTLASIGAGEFSTCWGLGKMKFLSTTPPTVASTNAFDGIHATCVVEVPRGTLATYQAATNYGNIAAQMVESES